MAEDKNESLSGLRTLRNKIGGTANTKKIDKIDKSIENISKYVLNKDQVNRSELLRSVFTDKIDNSMFKDISTNMYLSYETINRLNNYQNSEEVVDNLPYCARALKVLTDEIIAPDHLTKTILQFLQTENPSDEEKEFSKQVKGICRILKIENHLFDIVSETLKLGDQFIEICDYTSKNVPIVQTLLNEQKLDDENDSPIIMEDVTVKFLKNEVNEIGNVITEEKEIIFKTSITEDIREDGKEKVEINNIRLLVHDPRFVIKLQSHRFKMNLGYLVIPKPSTSNFFSSNQNSTCGGFSTAGSFSGSSLLFGQYREVTGIDKIYVDILQTIKKYLKKDDIVIDKKEVKEMISRIIKEIDNESTWNFEIRYVPPERMQHFKLSSKKFFPYGEGIFYKSIFAAKLLVAFETALVIKRISDSSDKRIMYVESGLPRNVRNLIEDIKEKLRKRKISIGTMGNISSIPSMITNYEEYYIPQNKGKRHVEFDQLPAAVNVRDISDELKLLRDFLVSSLEVPPSYLNLEENLSNKSALSFENMLFARTIISYQRRLSEPLTDLFDKIYKIVYGKNLPDFINITFSPPKMLENERMAESVETASRIINTLKEVGISTEYSKRKYLSIDWEELKKFETQENLDKETGKEEEEDQGMGTMGGMGSSLY